MELVIRYGLLLAWLAFGFAVLWWWRRRLTSKHYSYSERAAVILQAIKQNADLGLVYWSRREKRFLRRIVTPMELDGYSMKAFDHTANDVRTFKVTRIRVVELVPRGSPQEPPHLTIPASTWALGGLGVVALGLLVVFLFRARNAAQSPPLSTNLAPFEASATPETPAPLPAAAPTPAPSQPPSAESAAAPVPVPATGEVWAVIVVDSPDTPTNLLARILHAAVKCTDTEADALARQIRARGRAKVWEGRRADAELLREILESDDIVVRLEAADKNQPPAE